MYAIIAEAKIQKKIAHLDPPTRERVIHAIDGLATNPRPPGKKIKHFHGIEHGYRLRVGDVRVVYSVEDTMKQVFVVDVGYRGDIY